MDGGYKDQDSDSGQEGTYVQVTFDGSDENNILNRPRMVEKETRIRVKKYAGSDTVEIKFSVVISYLIAASGSQWADSFYEFETAFWMEFQTTFF
jgi:hypothetical protein